MLQHFAQSFPETRVWDFFLPGTPCIGPCTNFEPHQHWAKSKCSYDFASDVTKDANGNTIEKDVDGTVTEYTYDDQNRLLSVKPAEASGGGGQATVEFTYDADGARVAKTVNGATTEYLLDKNQRYHQVLEERTDSGALIAEYVYGNQRISIKRGGEDRFYHYDGHGSTSELTDAAGLVTDEYSYEAFGNLIASTGIGVNPFLYTGEAWDSETGMEYLRARYYMPGIGRFLNMDMHPGNNQIPLTLNKYLYGNANPVMFVDPSGEFGIVSVSISICIAGALASVAIPA
jgi:large repetitive protein